MKGSGFCLTLVLSLTLAGSAAQAAPITYSAPYAGGLGYVPTFGEVFTPTASNTVLSSFSFYLQLSGTGPYTFSEYVYSWNGSAVTGGPLFSASGVTSSDGFYGFSPNLTLTAGQSYIAMLSWASGWAEGLGCAAFNVDCLVNPSPNTQFHFTNSTTDAGWHNAANWNGLVNGMWRVAFNLQLGDTPVGDVAVPEPATLSLVGAGLIAALRRAVRRRISNG